VRGHHSERIPLTQRHDAELGSANADRIRQHGFEHRLELARRAGDRPQDLAGRRLLLQRLGEIVGTLAQLVEQPGVLDGDDGLGGKVLDQFDLLVGEGANLLAVDDDRADNLVSPQQRHDDVRPCPTQSDGRRTGQFRRRIRLLDRLLGLPSNLKIVGSRAPGSGLAASSVK
jgi:hypothetical protein